MSQNKSIIPKTHILFLVSHFQCNPRNNWHNILYEILSLDEIIPGTTAVGSGTTNGIASVWKMLCAFFACIRKLHIFTEGWSLCRDGATLLLSKFMKYNKYNTKQCLLKYSVNNIKCSFFPTSSLWIPEHRRKAKQIIMAQ